MLGKNVFSSCILREGGKNIIRAEFLQHHFTVDHIWVNGCLGCQKCLDIHKSSLICSTHYPSKCCCTGHAQKTKLLTETVGRKYIKAEDNFFLCLFLLSNSTKSVLQVVQIFSSTCWNLMSGEHFCHGHYWEHRCGFYLHLSHHNRVFIRNEPSSKVISRSNLQALIFQ